MMQAWADYLDSLRLNRCSSDTSRRIDLLAHRSPVRCLRAISLMDSVNSLPERLFDLVVTRSLRACFGRGYPGKKSAMADIMTPAQRSERMSRIRSQDTKPELLVRRFLHGEGFRFRLHVRDLPGRPDLVLPKYGAVVFVEGCFWHGHSCQKGRIPGTNPVFWQSKVAANQARDKRNHRDLRRKGWRVFRIWECQLAKNRTRNVALARLASRILA